MGQMGLGGCVCCSHTYWLARRLSPEAFKLLHEIASRNCLTKLPHEIASRNCLTKLPHEIASRNCLTKLPHEIASRNCTNSSILGPNSLTLDYNTIIIYIYHIYRKYKVYFWQKYSYVSQKNGTPTFGRILGFWNGK